MSDTTLEQIDTTADIVDETPETLTPDVAENTDTEAETFPLAYVQDLRRENAKYRDRAKGADALAQRLHTELVRATGRLADPTDLAFDAGHLDDPATLAAALDGLLEAKPHLKSRKVVGDIGQGVTGATAASVDLAALLRSRAL